MVNWKSKYLKMKLKYINAKQKGGANFNNLHMHLRQMIGMNLSPATYNVIFAPKDRIDWCPNQLMKEKYCKKQELALDNNNVECRRCVDNLIDYYKVKYGPKPYILAHRFWTYIGLNPSGVYELWDGPGVFIFNDGSLYEGYFDNTFNYEEEPGLYYANDGRIIKGFLFLYGILNADNFIIITEDYQELLSDYDKILFGKKYNENRDDEFRYDIDKEAKEANEFEVHPNPTNFEFINGLYIETENKKDIKKQQQQDTTDYTDKQCYYENGVSGTKRKKGPNAASCGSGNNKPGCCISDEPWKTHCNWVVSDGCRKKQSDEFVAQPNQTNLESDEFVAQPNQTNLESDEFEEQPNQTNLEFINQEQQQQHITDYTDKQCHYENGVSGTKRKKGPNADSCGDNKPGCCTSDEPWKTHCKWVVRDGCRKK